MACALAPLDVGLDIDVPDLGDSLYPDVSSLVVRAAVTPSGDAENAPAVPSPGTPMVCGVHDEVPVEVQRFLWGSKAGALDLQVKPTMLPDCVQSLPMLRRYEVARRPRAARCHVEAPHVTPFAVRACN